MKLSETLKELETHPLKLEDMRDLIAKIHIEVFIVMKEAGLVQTIDDYAHSTAHAVEMCMQGVLQCPSTMDWAEFREKCQKIIK